MAYAAHWIPESSLIQAWELNDKDVNPGIPYVSNTVVEVGYVSQTEYVGKGYRNKGGGEYTIISTGTYTTTDPKQLCYEILSMIADSDDGVFDYETYKIKKELFPEPDADPPQETNTTTQTTNQAEVEQVDPEEGSSLSIESVEFDTEDVQVGSTGAVNMSIDINKLLLKLVDPFFSVDQLLANIPADEVNSLSSNEDKLNKISELCGLPSKDKPGIFTVVNKVIELVLQAVGTFVEQFILLKEAVTTLIDALKSPVEYADEITEIVGKLKELIDSVKKLFTDTKQWVIDILMTPFEDIKIPVPPFEIDLGAIIPAFPIKIEVPQINKVFPFEKGIPDLSGVKGLNVATLKILDEIGVPFEELAKLSKLVDFNTLSEKLKNPVELAGSGTTFGANSGNTVLSDLPQEALAKIKALNLTPEKLSKISNLGLDLSNVNKFIPSSPPEIDLGVNVAAAMSFASQIKEMIIGIITSPLKILMGFVNTILDTITGTIQFDFSGFKELLGMMPPTVDSMITIFLKIVDAFMPNFSTVYEKVKTWLEENGKSLKPGSKDYMQIVGEASVYIREMEITGEDLTTEEDSVEGLVTEVEDIVNQILDYRDKMSVPTEGLVDEFFSQTKSLGKQLKEKLTEFNKKCNKEGVPNTYVTTEYIQGVSELISVVNQVAENGTGDALIKIHEDMIENVDKINTIVAENSDVIDTFYTRVDGTSVELIREEIEGIIGHLNGLLGLVPEDVTYMMELDEDNEETSDLETKIDDAIEYIQRVQYLKNNIYKTADQINNRVDGLANDIWSNGDDYLDGFRANIDEIYTYRAQYVNINYIDAVQNVIDAIDELYGYTIEPTTNEYGEDEYLYEPTQNITDASGNIVDVINGDLDNIRELADNLMAAISQLNQYDYDKVELFDVDTTFIADVDEDLEIAAAEEELIITYLTSIKDSMGSVGEVSNRDRRKLTEFAEFYQPQVQYIKDNAEDDGGAMDNFQKSVAHNKKLAETPPNLDEIADHFKTFTDLVAAGPNTIVSLLTTMFEYALEGLPSIPGVS